MRILLIGSEGYIGSFLNSHLVDASHHVVSCDLIRGSGDQAHHICSDYSELTMSILSEFDVVINLSGHSSVDMANKTPVQAIENNAVNLFKLALKCRELSIPLIYASSGSIYSSKNVGDYTLKGSSINAYDGSKMAADLLLSTLDIPAVALCFGTVSGWSSKVRNELIFNSMNISAYRDKVVNIWNGENLRSILFLDDLVKYIEIILNKINIVKGFHRIQLSSWSGSINELGTAIARHWKARINMNSGEGTYSFVLSDHAFRKSFDSYVTKSNIADQCDKFIEKWR